MKITTDYQDIVDEKTVPNCWKDDFTNSYNVETSSDESNTDYELEIKQFIECNHDFAESWYLNQDISYDEVLKIVNKYK